MGRSVIAVYRPKPGLEVQLLSAVAGLAGAQHAFSEFEAPAP